MRAKKRKKSDNYDDKIKDTASKIVKTEKQLKIHHQVGYQKSENYHDIISF